MWTARAPAKLNLRLDVKGRRSDGYHELETVMVPIRLSDTLELRSPAAESQSGGISLEIRGAEPISARGFETVPEGGSNLVVRALELLRARSGQQHGARVLLVKRIPPGAGLGGGSSDAAAALRLANRAWGLDWSRERLAELAADVGSDVPFFCGLGAAICRGRGEQVERLPPLPTLHFVVVKPPVSLATAGVYDAFDRGVDPMRTHGGVSHLREGRWGRIHDLMHNSLEAAAASLTPWIARLKAAFGALDCLAHQLTGSGSAYFGVCRHAQHARRLATILRNRQLGSVYATRSCL